MRDELPRANVTRRRKEVVVSTVATRTYEYNFVRLGEGRTSAAFGPQGEARRNYEEVVHEYARDGWRLVQIFAPGVAAFGAAKYYELIFEREAVDDA
jgi:hypothetical protein